MEVYILNVSPIIYSDLIHERSQKYCRHSISTGDSICILALGSGERLLYPSNRVRTANPVSVRVRVMVSASLSSAAVESPVLIES